MQKKERMNPVLKRIFITIIITGILGSIIHGLSAMFIHDVGGEVAAYIIGYGCALSGVIGAAVISVFNANLKKGEDSK